MGLLGQAVAPRLLSPPRALKLRQSRAPESPDFGQRHARLRATSGGLLRLPILLQIRLRRCVRVVTCLARCVVCPFPEIFRHLLTSTYQNRRWCHPYSRRTAGQAVVAAARPTSRMQQVGAPGCRDERNANRSRIRPSSNIPMWVRPRQSPGIKSTNKMGCDWYIKAVYADKSVSEAVKFDFCEEDLLISF